MGAAMMLMRMKMSTRKGMMVAVLVMALFTGIINKKPKLRTFAVGTSVALTRLSMFVMMMMMMMMLMMMMMMMMTMAHQS